MFGDCADYVTRFASNPNPTCDKEGNGARAADDETAESTLSELSAASDLDDMEV